MIIDSKYTKAFKSNNLTHLKYDELLGLARLVREHRNAVSAHVNQHLLQYLDYSKFQFLKEMRAMFNGSISSSFDAQLYTDVYTAYQNKFTAIQQKLKFETVTFQGFELYKRDNKKHKKGDLKRIIKHNDYNDSFISFVKNTDDYDFIVRRVGGNCGKAFLNEENPSKQSNYFIKNNTILSNERIVEIINSTDKQMVDFSVGTRSISKNELIEIMEDNILLEVKRQQKGFDFEKLISNDEYKEISLWN